MVHGVTCEKVKIGRVGHGRSVGHLIGIHVGLLHVRSSYVRVMKVKELLYDIIHGRPARGSL